MESKIKVSDIFTLLEEFIYIFDGMTISVFNCTDDDISNELKKITSFKYVVNFVNLLSNADIREYINVSTEYLEISKTIFIIFNRPEISFKSYLNLSRFFYENDVKNIVLTRKNKRDTKNLKAFLVFYTPYRILGNALLLRRS